MTANDALRFLAHEAARCRDRDAHEALCLWLPALCKIIGVKPADDFEALALQETAHRELRAVNESPLVEAHCEICSFAETLPECRFSAGHMPGPSPNAAVLSVDLARAWCDQCQAERHFVREAVTA